MNLIPKGDYCYEWIEPPSEKNGWTGEIKWCPYFQSKIINGVETPWCVFLNLGGIDNRWTEEEWLKIKEHYKSEEELDKELPFFLLWDACKECEENYE